MMKMKASWLIPLGMIAAGVGLSRNAYAQEGTFSAYGDVSGQGMVIPEGARIDVFSDNGTPETDDDMFVGRGSTLYYDGDTMYSVNHIQRDLAGTPQKEGFTDGDSLYFRFGVDGDTTSYETSPDQAFAKNKIAAPGPAEDLNIDLFVRKKGTQTGINDRRYSDGMKAYPNPADRMLTVDIPDDDMIREVRVFDVAGKMVKYDMTGVESDIYRLDVGDFPTGCYFVTVETAKGRTATQKFIKR